MADPLGFETERLFLRQWKPADRELFAALNADSRVMKFFPAQLTRAESDAIADRCEALIRERGRGFWAAELKASREFIGFVGLHTPSAELPFLPCVEIGWRLSYSHWGKGLVSAAARGALRVGFTSLSLNEIVSFTAVGNSRSRAVMERLNNVSQVLLDILNYLKAVRYAGIACTVCRVVIMTHNTAFKGGR